VCNTQDYWIFGFYPSSGILKITFAEQSLSQVETIVEQLDVYLRMTYFQVNDNSFQQKDCMAMGRSLSLIITIPSWSILGKWFLTWHNIHHCCQYIDDIFAAWSHGPERLRNSLSHLNTSRLSIQPSQRVRFHLWMLWSLGKGRHWPLNLQKTQPHWSISQLQI
jgi:hypothetical protein